MGAKEVEEFITHLAREQNVMASTQNQALNAIVFLYKEVLGINFDQLHVEQAKKPEKLLGVFSWKEVKAVMAHLDGIYWLMAQLLYGAGLRLIECVRLRVKDIDFDYHQILVRDGKGAKDRVTILPHSVEEPLRQQIQKVRLLHEKDLAEGFGEVYLLSTETINLPMHSNASIPPLAKS